MTVVTISETYDLSTVPNKMSLVGIHTPSANAIKKSYPGLAVNHKFFKLLKCDVSLACASILPADPLQIGVESGDIAPQDMFNPILYKAVTTESMSVLEHRIIGLGSILTPDVRGESVDAINDVVTGESNEFSAYYGLLSNRDGFRIAHPQQGLRMTGLVPLVHERLYQFGENQTGDLGGAPNQAIIKTNAEGDGIQYSTTSNHAIFGGAKPLPRMNTLYLDINSYLTTGYGVNQGVNQNVNARLDDMPYIPHCYVACIILPPAKLNRLYFRLHVRWYVQFSEVRPISDLVAFDQLAFLGDVFYKTDYANASKDMDAKLDMVDTRNANIEKIMEGK